MKHVLCLAAGLFALAAANPALAGSPYNEFGTRRGGNPAASGVPNVPDLQGCVKWCQRDLDPCDPPLFKRADGRCNDLD